jgi:hypothetical protein
LETDDRTVVTDQPIAANDGGSLLNNDDHDTSTMCGWYYAEDACVVKTSYSCWGVWNEDEIYVCFNEGRCRYGDRTGCCGDPEYDCN